MVDVDDSGYIRRVNSPVGIFDTSRGQCTAVATLKGEPITCDLATNHDGWAHMNREHELLWQAAIQKMFDPHQPHPRSLDPKDIFRQTRNALNQLQK